MYKMILDLMKNKYIKEQSMPLLRPFEHSARMAPPTADYDM